jgi:hypothetical protein
MNLTLALKTVSSGLLSSLVIIGCITNNPDTTNSESKNEKAPEIISAFAANECASSTAKRTFRGDISFSWTSPNSYGTDCNSIDHLDAFPSINAKSYAVKMSSPLLLPSTREACERIKLKSNLYIGGPGNWQLLSAKSQSGTWTLIGVERVEIFGVVRFHQILGCKIPNISFNNPLSTSLGKNLRIATTLRKDLGNGKFTSLPFVVSTSTSTIIEGPIQLN